MSVVRGTQLGRMLAAWQSPNQPDYVALAAGIRGLLRDGRLALAVRLPAERELAEALGISRTTVSAAYRELRESGHLTSRRGAGSWTAMPEGLRLGTGGLWADEDDSDVIDLAAAALAAPPQLSAAVAEAVQELPRYAAGAGYFATGLPVLRDAVARGYAARGLKTRPEQIMITNGVQHAVDLLLRLLIGPGQPVLVESPTYPNVLAALAAHRARILTYNLDPATGWDADLLVSTIRTGRARMAYLIPEFHNPTGHLLPAGPREQVAAAARAAGTDLVVDESFVDLQLAGAGADGPAPPPVASYDRHARVISVGGMSKPYWGGLRVGWIRAASPMLARLAQLRAAMDMSGPVLDQLIAVRLLDRAGEIIPRRRIQLARQRDAFLAALAEHVPEWRTAVPPGGVSLWTELDAPISTALAHHAADHGVRLASGPRFGFDGTLERYLRLPFTLPERDLVEAARRLAATRADIEAARTPAAWSSPALVA